MWINEKSAIYGKSVAFVDKSLKEKGCIRTELNTSRFYRGCMIPQRSICWNTPRGETVLEISTDGNRHGDAVVTYVGDTFNNFCRTELGLRQGARLVY